MRTVYLNELKEINSLIERMGELCVGAISETMRALETGDKLLAREIIDGDEHINEYDRRIETLCFRVLLTQQPVASDLRTVSSALKMITDMERIGDFAVDIAEIVLSSVSDKPFELDFIGKMLSAVNKMTEDSVRAFTERNVELAFKVRRDDDVVDKYFNESKKLLLEQISKDESFVDRALDLMMVSKYLERIGDHAVNISDWVVYALTGGRKKNPVEEN